VILFVRRDLMQIYFFAVRLTCGIYHTYCVLCYSTNVQEVVIFLTKCWKIAGDRSRYVQFNYWYSSFWNMSWVNWTKIGHWKELFLLACKPFHPNLARDPSTCICWVCFSIPDRGAEYCDKRGCLSVCLCLCVCLSTITSSIFTKFFVHVTCGRDSVLIWRRYDTLCISGFMDDVIFAHKPRLLDFTAQLWRNSHAALGLAINCAQQ